MTFWQKNGWWLPLLGIVLLAATLKLTEAHETTESVAAEAARVTLIIDAGHGGADGGAVAPDGILEADINLDIALRLEALARFWGVPTRMTRVTAEIDYPPEAQTIAARKRADQQARIELVNSCHGGVLLSIHQNNYSAPQPCGPQVFFSSGDGEAFATILQKNLTQSLAPNNRRVAAQVSENVYLLKRVSNAAVLVECGFLSNPQELEKLESECYRGQLSVLMLASWLQYTNGIFA